MQCGNMAREGLRTLVVAKKILSEDQYQEFEVSAMKFRGFNKIYKIIFLGFCMNRLLTFNLRYNNKESSILFILKFNFRNEKNNMSFIF